MDHRSSPPLGLIGCVDHVGIWDIVDLVASVVDHDTTTSFIERNAITCGAEVKNLADVSRCYLGASECASYLDIRQAVPLYGGDTSTIVELDLPNAAEVCQQVLDEFAILDIPHLECAV